MELEGGDLNGVGTWHSQEGTDYRNVNTHDDIGYSADTSWTYTWDVQDRLTKVEREGGDFGGTDEMTIEKNADGSIHSWVRYQYEGLNLLRMDQMYDGSDTGSDLNEGDPFRPLCVYTHGPGSIGQIVQNKAYMHTDGDAVPDATTELWYFYDRMGNMLNMHYGAGYSTWDMDAYGNQTDSGNWPGMDSNGPKERLTGKMLDIQTGLYFFMARWYDPEVGRFVGRELYRPDSEMHMPPTLTCSADRIRFQGQMQARTPYSFCRNNTTFFVDSDGEAEYPGDRNAACAHAYDSMKSGFTGKEWNDHFGAPCANKCLNNCAMTTDSVKVGAYLSQCLQGCHDGMNCAKALLEYYKCIVDKTNPTDPEFIKCLCKLGKCRKLVGL